MRCLHMTWHLCLTVCGQCKDCMSAALAASRILKKMARETSDADEAQDMLELASHYETHGVGKTQAKEGRLTDGVRGYVCVYVCLCASQVCSVSATALMRNSLRSCWFVRPTFGAKRRACGWRWRLTIKALWLCQEFRWNRLLFQCLFSLTKELLSHEIFLAALCQRNLQM